MCSVPCCRSQQERPVACLRAATKYCLHRLSLNYLLIPATNNQCILFVLFYFLPFLRLTWGRINRTVKWHIGSDRQVTRRKGRRVRSAYFYSSFCALQDIRSAFTDRIFPFVSQPSFPSSCLPPELQDTASPV